VPREPQQQLFVSYSHADRTEVLDLASCLRRLDFKTWLDTDLRGGEYIFEAVTEAIEVADVYLYVISTTSVRSYWVRQELNTAKALEFKREGRRPLIVPVRLDDAEVPTMLMPHLLVDLRGLEPREWLEPLRRVLTPDAPPTGDRGPDPGPGASSPADAQPPGRELRRLPHGGQVLGVAFSPDGERLATASEDLLPHVWALTGGDGPERVTRNPLRVPELGRHGHRGLLAVAFGPIGNTLATGGCDHTARVRDLTSRRQQLRVPHDGWVRSVAFRPDGLHLASVGEDGIVRVWSVPDRGEVLRIELGTPLTATQFSADGQHLLTATKHGSAQVWDLAARGELLTVSHDRGELWSAAYAPDGRSIATAGTDGSVCVWDLASGRPRRIANGFATWSVAYAPDGRSLAMAGERGKALIWDLVDDRERASVTHDAVVWSVAFSPDGTRLATASADGTARVWAL
jgi:WD40 repeat protein